MSLNTSVIRLLVLKDWQLFQKQLAFYVLAGIVALCFLGLAKPWAFYVGSLMLLIVVVSSISTSLVVERKEQTLAFVMSLPVSPREFTLSKLIGNLLTFGVPFVVLLGGALALVMFSPLPDGLFVYTLLIFAWLLFAYAISLAVAMSVESEGWATFAMIGSMVMINPYIMGLGQLEVIRTYTTKNAVVWTTPTVAIMTTLALLAVAVIGVTTWHHARKPAFY
jgi:ABC-2 type transport system permease protein